MELWEILVPASNHKEKFSYEHHKEWDNFVKKIAMGLTIMKSSKGEWVSPVGKLYKDRMIPVRIQCSRKQFEDIIKFTVKHYDQEAVLGYKVSDDVIMEFKEGDEK